MKSEKIIVPAIIAKTQEELVEKINKVKDFFDRVQLDVMDGKFVPNNSLDFDFKLPKTNCHFEAHLMIKNPLKWIKKNYMKIDTVLAHIETCDNPKEVIDFVKDKEKLIGFVLNPETPLDRISDFINDIDQVLIMTVNPGFYGSPFLPEMVEKISELRKFSPDLDIEVDGGVTPSTISLVDKAGANLFVSGSYIVKADDVKEAISKLKEILSDRVDRMKKYDVVVIGSGSGGEIVELALNNGFSVAWVDKGPLGGTCLNVGCIPSKMLIYPADRIMEIQEAEKFGIKAEIKNIDFKKIMEHMKEPIVESHEQMKRGLINTDNFHYYQGEGHFISDYTVEINKEQIKGEKIFIGSGARPFIPPIARIKDIDYLTNETVFDIKEKPKNLIIIGGGYVAVEFAHFFSAIGTNVTILQRGNRLITNSEPEISELLLKLMKKRINIHTNIEVKEVKKEKKGCTVVGKDNISGKEFEFKSEKIFLAAGRKSNADLLKVEKTGVETDQRGYIKVNEFLETTKRNIWAFGDAIGKYMFKHVANEEAIVAWRNAATKHKHPMDYSAVPYAVFTYPQIAAVGLTELEAKRKHQILVGKAKYSDVAKGEAMVELEGFTKAIVDKKDGKILGFHIIGPYAPILIQEVVNAMALGGQLGFIGQGMHIHPALPELILRTLGNLKEPS